MRAGFVASVPLASWFQFDLEAGYLHSVVFGEAPRDNALLDADIGFRQLALTPVVRFYVASKAEFFLLGRLPVYTSIARTDTEPSTDGRVLERVEERFADNYGLALGARSAVARTTFITFALHYGERTRRLYDVPLFPSFALEVRF